MSDGNCAGLTIRIIPKPIDMNLFFSHTGRPAGRPAARGGQPSKWLSCFMMVKLYHMVKPFNTQSVRAYWWCNCGEPSTGEKATVVLASATN